MQINIILEKEFYENAGNSDLYEPNKVEFSKQIKVKKMSTMLEMMKQISEMLELSTDDIRLWSIMSRYNQTIRPLNCYDLKECVNKTVAEASKQESSWTVFVETANDLSFSTTFDYNSLINKTPSEIQSMDKEQQLVQQQQQKLAAYKPDEVMIFFKFYEPKSSTLRYVFRMNLTKSATLNTIQDRINKKMRFQPNTDLLFYEEVKMLQITPLVHKDMPLSKLAHEQLLDGDIYVFQINEKEKLQAYDYPTVVDYFKDLSLHFEVLFLDKNVPNDEGFTLVLSLKMKYEEFAKLVAQHLNYDYDKIQFFYANSTSNSYDLKSASSLVNQAIKYDADFQLKDAFNIKSAQQFHQQQQQQTGQQQMVRKLYYQKLNIKTSEMEERRPFKLTWVNASLKNEKELILMPMKKASVRDLLVECRQGLLKEGLITKEQWEDEEGFRLRLVEIVGSKIHRIFRDEVLIENLDAAQVANKLYRVEQVLPEELELSSNYPANNGDEYLLPIAHFSKEIYATFGLPFLLKIKLGEPFKDIKQRIQKKLEVNDKEFATYRFALISMGAANYIPDEEDLKFNLANLGGVQPWLGIDHQNKAANKNKSRFSSMEKAIKIFN